MLAALQDLLRRTQLDHAHERLIHYLERSAVPRLASYLDLMIFSFVYFMALDLFIYYILAPKLCKLAPNGNKTSRGVDQLSKEGSLQLKWAHMIPSFIHSLLVAPAALYFVYSDPHNLSATFQTRLCGFSPTIGSMLAFSGGYFIWDTLICLWNPQVYGPSFLAHAIMALIGVIAGFGRDFTFDFYISRYMIFEISTIFVDMHWFFAKTGYDKSKSQFTTDVLGLLCYLVFRMAFGYWTSYNLVLDMIDWYKTGKANMAAIVIANTLHILSHILNMYWFVKLLSSATGTKNKSKKE